jgi:hypothetical protein
MLARPLDPAGLEGEPGGPSLLRPETARVPLSAADQRSPRLDALRLGRHPREGAEDRPRVVSGGGPVLWSTARSGTQSSLPSPGEETPIPRAVDKR